MSDNYNIDIREGALVAAALAKYRSDMGPAGKESIDALLKRLPAPAPDPRVVLFPDAPFTISLEPVANNPGQWSSTRVSISAGGDKIGEYLRLYPSYGDRTFRPFQAEDGKWYALYSADYTTTRLMSLPDCKDLGGEESDSLGFCPVDFYIPRWRYVRSADARFNNPADEWIITDNAPAHELAEALEEVEKGAASLGPVQWMTYGYSAGCIWGDDHSWKIQVVDLSRVSEGIIVHDDRMGYVEMPYALDLRDCIDLNNWEPGSRRIRLTHATHMDLSKHVKTD